MCGIVGYVTVNEEVAEEERKHFLRYALILDTLRGADSTGVMTIHNDFEVSALKSTAPGHKFVELEEYGRFNSNGWATVGHNRAATQGSVKVDNSHPFTFGPVHLVHNGTLTGRGSSLVEYDYRLDVDSMQIALSLSKVAPDRAYEVLESINGTFALVWFDERDQSVNFARNPDRPLHVTWNKKKTFLTFMSDGHMLRTLNNSFRETNLVGEAIYAIGPMRHIKMKKGSLVPEVTAFRPFQEVLRQQAAQRQRSRQPQRSASSGAVHSHVDKWAERRDRFKERRNNVIPFAGTSLGSTKKVEIAGRNFDVPEPHKHYLNSILDLEGGERYRFKLLNYIQLAKHKMLCFGELLFEPWSTPEHATWLDAVILQDVMKLHVKAYKDQDWTVTPVGITKPLTKHDGLGSLICLPVNYDWRLEEKVKKEELAQEIVDDLMKEDTELIRFCGALRAVGWVRKQLANGCVQCGENLTMEMLDEYLLVNEGRNIICESCVGPYMTMG